MDRRRALRTMGAAIALPVLNPSLVSPLSANPRLGPILSPVAPTLTPKEYEVIRILADVILPETQAEGAAEAGVPGFIDDVVGGWFDPEEAQHFKAGIAQLEETSEHSLGKAFAELTPEERRTLVDQLDRELDELILAVSDRSETGEPYQGPSPADHFFYQMKWLTLTGYYTSAVGTEQRSGFRIVPGGFEGCVLRDA